MSLTQDAPRIEPEVSSRTTLTVRSKRLVAGDVLEVTLARPDDSRLPDWAPGAHIDLMLPNGTTRQYSLVGDRWDAHTYTVAVLRERDGRGGSELIHSGLEVGMAVGFGGPRNNFRLAPAEEYLFVAGGIGITPILPMIRQAQLLDIPWRLLYLGRTRPGMAYLDELEASGDRVTVHAADERGRADLDTWMPQTGGAVRVYACGPERLLAAVDAWAAPLGRHAVRLERFTAAPGVGDGVATRFEVEIPRIGQTVEVAPDESIVDAVRRVGVEVLTSCGQGVCGTCETVVLRGDPEHRDSLLDDEERAHSDCMFPCISRARSARLVLDL